MHLGASSSGSSTEPWVTRGPCRAWSMLPLISQELQLVEVTVLLLSPMPKVTVPYCVLLTSPMGPTFSDVPGALKARAVGLSWECRVCGELMNAETSS